MDSSGNRVGVKETNKDKVEDKVIYMESKEGYLEKRSLLNFHLRVE
jgi:hypothetical protein